MNWLVLLIVIVMLAAAIAVLSLRNLLGALAAASVVSLGLSVLFVILRAPDVAMTEAAVGTGLSGVVMAMGLRRLGLWRVEATSSEAGAEAERRLGLAQPVTDPEGERHDV
ncbi:MAG: hydrogenase subunit MbhD domain-containing protein [Pseudomonadota bacterium]|nr:hydrogenase subunit MbhD domain-containing protein [Pseudomonadota bacterium]